MGGASVFLYVSLPAIFLLLVASLLYYLCCSRKFRLNWFEQSLLQEASHSQNEKSSFGRSASPERTSQGRVTPPSTGPPQPIITTSLYEKAGGGYSYGACLQQSWALPPPYRPSNALLDDNRASSLFAPDYPTLTFASNVRYVSLRHQPSQDSMGSKPSSPTSDDISMDNNSLGSSIGGLRTAPLIRSLTSGSRDSPVPSHGMEQVTARRGSSGAVVASGDPEPFWVPPTVWKRKRAMSLIPHLDTGSPPTVLDGELMGQTRAASGSLLEMVNTASPTEKLTESVSKVQTQQRRRRASMQDALDITKINASLYDRPTGLQRQQSSIEEEHLGSVNFALHYDPDQGILRVHLIQARDLVPRDFSGTSDPYCKLCLLPMRRTQMKSKIVRKTVSPEFDEEFVFNVSPCDVNNRSLELLLCDFDQFSRDECIGQIVVPLSSVDINDGVTLWKGLSRYDIKTCCDPLGDIMLSISFLPCAQRLTIVVVKCRNLKPSEETKHSTSPFVKVSLISGAKRVKKKKTTVKRSTLSPVWNEALVFSVSKQLFSTLQIEFVVANDSLIGNSEALGKVVVGAGTSGEELAHWNDIINGRTASARWHHLKTPDA